MAAVGEILSSPNEIEKRYLGRLLQASFSSQLLGLEPDSLRVRRDDLRRTLFIIDSHVLVAFLAKESLGHVAMKEMVANLRALGAECVATPRLIQETAQHVDWARSAFASFGATGPEILDIVEGRNGFRPNLFVAGYIEARSKTAALSWGSYLADCLQVPRIGGKIDDETVQRSLEKTGHFKVIDLGLDDAARKQLACHLDAAFRLIKEKRQQRGTYKSDSQVWAEAEVVATVQGKSEPGEVAGRRAMFVSNSRVLDGLSGFPLQVTIDMAGLSHWAGALVPSRNDEAAAFETMIYSLYEEGITLFDRSAFRRVFDPLVSGAEDRFAAVLSQYRDLLEDMLGPDPAKAFAEIHDLSKPAAIRSIDAKLLEQMKEKAEREEKRAAAAEAKRGLSDAERKELEKLRAEKAERKRRATKRKRAAASKPRRRRGR